MSGRGTRHEGGGVGREGGDPRALPGPAPGGLPALGPGCERELEAAGALRGFARGSGPLCSYEQYFGSGTRLTVIGEIGASLPVRAAAPRTRETVGWARQGRAVRRPRGQPCGGRGPGPPRPGTRVGGRGAVGLFFRV